MPRSIKMIAMTAALLLVVGVAPAYADEDDTTDTTEAPEIEAVEGDEESEGSHINGKALVLFGKGFDFSKGSALGGSIDAYLDTFEEGSGEEFDWAAFGDWLADEDRKLLSDAQLALLSDPPRNFGQLVSALRKHHGRNENSPVYAAAQEGDGDGDDGDTVDTDAADDDANGKGKKSDHPNKGKKNNG